MGQSVPRRNEDHVDLRHAWRTLSVVSMASVLSALNGSALNVALPDIVRALHAGPVAATWILLSFQFTMTVLMLSFGRLADMYGRRSMYLVGLITYTAASLLLGFAGNVELLIGLRVVQATGAAMLLANSAALVSAAFPQRRLGQGMGLYIASFSIASLAGPTLGGWLTQTIGWRWVFWYNVPLGVVCIVWAWFALHPAPTENEKNGLDVAGNVLALVGLGCLLWAIAQVTDTGWLSVAVAAGTVGFAVLFAVFVWWERRARHPVLDVALFADRRFSAGMAGSFLNSVSRFAVILLVSLYYQSARGMDAITAGTMVLPLVGSAMLGSVLFGVFALRFSADMIARTGGTVATVGLGLLTLMVSRDTGYLPMVAGMVLVGLGSGVFLPANTTTMLDGLPSSRLGIVNGMRLTVMNVGGAISTALALSILTSPVADELRNLVFAGSISTMAPQALGDLIVGYRWAFGCMTVLSALGAVLAFVRGRIPAAIDPVPADRVTDDLVNQPLH